MTECTRRLHLRCGPHADRPLRRRARQGAHRRSRRGADQGADEARIPRSTGRRSTRSSSAAPTRPARTTATSRAWRCCWRACRIRVPGITVNRLCASGLNAVGDAARAIRAGEIDFAIAGGVESMTRAPFVMGKAQEAFQRSAEIYDTTHRLALHQSADEAAVRRRLRCRRPARTSPRNTRSRARTRMRSRCARSSAPARRMAAGYFAEEIVPVEVPGGKAGPVTVDKDEHPRPGHDARRARQAQAVRAQSRHRHRRQCVGRQRRRRGDDHRLGGGGEAARPHAARAHPRHGVGRRAAARHGHRPGAVDPQADGAARAQDRRLRRDRAQRGVRLAGARLPAPARRRRRRRARQSERRRDRARPSARHVGRAARAHRGRISWRSAAASARSPPCASASGRACRWRSSGSDLTDDATPCPARHPPLDGPSTR